jgi:monothiol glutaredoxin
MITAFNTEEDTMDAKAFVQQTVTDNPVVLFMKGSPQFPQCGFSSRAIQLLKACGVQQVATVKDFSNWPTIPQLYVNGEFIGGSDIMGEMYESGELQQLLGSSPGAA